MDPDTVTAFVVSFIFSLFIFFHLLALSFFLELIGGKPLPMDLIVLLTLVSFAIMFVGEKEDLKRMEERNF